MRFLGRLFGGGRGEAGAHAGSSPTEASDEAAFTQASDATFELHGDRHRVTVWLRLQDAALENEREQLRVFALEDRLMRALDAAGTGEHDTNSLEAGFLALRLVGPDADAIVATVMPLLGDAPAGSYLAVRRGPTRTAEDRVDLGSRA